MLTVADLGEIRKIDSYAYLCNNAQISNFFPDLLDFSADEPINEFIQTRQNDKRIIQVIKDYIKQQDTTDESIHGEYTFY